MKVIDARNVNDAILLGVDLFNNAFNYRVQESRNGTTYEALEPVTTVYRNPCERVCLIAQRDANPFFHLIESLWMLDGRKDLKPLTHFVESMKDFSDDGKSLWGAYGWRWKSYFGRDQLPLIIDMLKKDPNDRRAVLQMWDAKEDLNRDGKDVPCNTNIYFKIRDGRLNMAVCNRSNDMLWGAYGANVVHMSILQEYMASAIGVEMGVYRQVSDSFHVYLNPVWEKVKDLTIDPHSFRHLKNPYDTLEGYTPTPLFDDVSMFNSELDRFFSMHPTNIEAHKEGWHSPIFTDIAIPMLQVHRAYQMKDFKSSYEMLESIKAFDWRAACLNWLIKREQSYLSKTQKGATHE